MGFIQYLSEISAFFMVVITLFLLLLRKIIADKKCIYELEKRLSLLENELGHISKTLDDVKHKLNYALNEWFNYQKRARKDDEQDKVREGARVSL
jgi:hypothetical protein